MTEDAKPQASEKYVFILFIEIKKILRTAAFSLYLER